MKPGFLIEAFWQKKDNCVCVAFMKSLIALHGPGCGFKTRTRGRYIIVELKDGKILSFSKTELKEVNNKNQISFAGANDKSKEQKLKKLKRGVEVCFAVMVRNLQLRGFAGKELTQSEAIKLLTKEGTDTRNFHALLGARRTMSKKITGRNFISLKKKKSALLYNKKHITVCLDGWYEDFGVAKKLEEVPDLLGEKATGFFELKQ